MENSLKNKNVIVTGASSGIGKETSVRLAMEGANIVLAARSEDKLELLRKELSEFDVKVIVVKTDVSRLADCRNLLKTAARELGSVDILINNAGYTCQGNVTETDIKDIDNMIDVNLKGTIRLTKLALPYLSESVMGRIINVSSILGIIPIPTEAVYSSTKFGVRAFSYALAEELADTGIRVCLISPGPVDTPFIMDHLDNIHDLVLSPPVSSPAEIANMIIQSARDGKMERIKPLHTGILAKIGFLFPFLSRIIKPVMERQGRKRKARYRKRSDKPDESK